MHQSNSRVNKSVLEQINKSQACQRALDVL